MIKNKTVLEFEINGRKYSLELDPNAPLGEVHDVLCHFREFVVNRIKEEMDKIKPEQKV
jgi:hypothetical protein